MRIIKPHRFNPGDKKPLELEPLLKTVKFKEFKFNKRSRPKDKNRILLITCFSEFGCESIALMYCIPRIIQRNPAHYIIVVGWHGREYLYRHLADEYWEINEESQWLREYSLAFENTSKNISLLEERLKQYGQVLPGSFMGHICLGNTCLDCRHFWGSEELKVSCPKCNSDKIDRPLLADVNYHKKFAIKVPKPNINVDKYLKPNSVGIFARSRTCYGRNLPSEFYKNLIAELENKGYNIIWLGEKQSTLPCPVAHILDFSRLPESQNLELTLSIISHLQFTVQFWTASTRLASIMGVPWVLFESPDQIVGNGQEGKRILLTTDLNKKKIILSHYLKVLENQDLAFDLLNKAIEEMKEDNWNEIVGLVDEKDIISGMLKSWREKFECS